MRFLHISTQRQSDRITVIRREWAEKLSEPLKSAVGFQRFISTLKGVFLRCHHRTQGWLVKVQSRHRSNSFAFTYHHNQRCRHKVAYSTEAWCMSPHQPLYVYVTAGIWRCRCHFIFMLNVSQPDSSHISWPGNDAWSELKRLLTSYLMPAVTSGRIQEVWRVFEKVHISLWN